jgi:steroid delta-isomerase-like uncharacterized protein
MVHAAELHRRLFAAIQSRDFAAIRALYHPDCIYRVGDGIEQTGPESIVGDVRAFTTAFPDLSIEVRRQFEPSDDLSITEYVFAGTHRGPLETIPATGRPIEVVACSIIDAHGGHIAREHDYYDVMAMMSQLGVT